jgi:hypothetical protein
MREGGRRAEDCRLEIRPKGDNQPIRVGQDTGHLRSRIIRLAHGATAKPYAKEQGPFEPTTHYTTLFCFSSLFCTVLGQLLVSISHIYLTFLAERQGNAFEAFVACQEIAPTGASRHTQNTALLGTDPGVLTTRGWSALLR